MSRYSVDTGVVRQDTILKYVYARMLVGVSSSELFELRMQQHLEFASADLFRWTFRFGDFVFLRTFLVCEFLREFLSYAL